MSGNGHTAARLRALEVVWQAGRQCQRCHGSPRRFALKDSETGECWQENLPPSGCPGCGEPIAFTRILVIDQDPFPDEP